jgi:hypothetical protein
VALGSIFDLMDTPQKLAQSWVKFALFQLFCLVVCFMISGALVRYGIFNDDFILSGGFWKAGWAMFGLWFALSTVALIHYRWRMDLGIFIVCSAIIASPFSTAIFCAVFKGNEGISSLFLPVLVSALFGLFISFGIIKAAEFLEEGIYPLFRILGF